MEERASIVLISTGYRAWASGEKRGTAANLYNRTILNRRLQLLLSLLYSSGFEVLNVSTIVQPIPIYVSQSLDLVMPAFNNTLVIPFPTGSPLGLWSYTLLVLPLPSFGGRASFTPSCPNSFAFIDRLAL